VSVNSIIDLTILMMYFVKLIQYQIFLSYLKCLS